MKLRKRICRGRDNRDENDGLEIREAQRFQNEAVQQVRRRLLFGDGVLAAGYSALAFAAHYASQYVPSAEYLSGILVDPIAKYFSKICESLRRFLDNSVMEVAVQKRQNK